MTNAKTLLTTSVRRTSLSRRVLLSAAATVAVLVVAPAQAQDTLKVGLVAAMSGQSAKSGEAIARGLSLAIDEINAKGGVLGKKLALVVRDDESNPAKGALAARELVQREKVVAFFGGLDTPVSLAIVPFANQAKVPFMGVWAAGTPITQNGAAENYVFRVSAVDDLVDVALVDRAIKAYGAKKPGMILINNPWGESNEKGLKAALAARKLPFAGVEKFENNDVDVVPQLTRLKEGGADVLFLVANVAPASQVVKSLDRMGWNVPIISHWGVAGGRFTELAGPSAAKVQFVQTFSFSGNKNPKATAVFDVLKKKYPEIKSYADVTPAVGIANAYDAMHLVALAIAKAGSTEGPKVRQGFYAIDSYDGLIKSYKKPFTPQNHDALSAGDYIFTYFKGDEILPLTN
jgi:branched-chain amino acid transport system substrate-binding protein